MGKWQMVVLCIAVLLSSLVGAYLKLLPISVFASIMVGVFGWLAPSPIVADVSKAVAPPPPDTVR